MRRTIGLLLALICLGPLWAGDGDGLPENFEARRALTKLVIAPDPSLLLKEKPQILAQDLSTHRVKFVVTQQKGPSAAGQIRDYVYLLFLNERLSDGSFPMGGAGSFILKRDLKTGDFVQVKVFLQDLGAQADLTRDDQGTFLRLRPSAEQPRTLTKLELFLQGQRMDTDVSLPFSLQQILSLPVSGLVASGLSPTDWDLVFPHYDPVAAPLIDLVKQVRSVLPSGAFVPEGVMDEGLRYRNLLTGEPLRPARGLGSLGFAKWLVDGVYAVAQPGRGLKIGPLLEQAGDRGSNQTSRQWEDQLQPFQGLDWARNLGLSLQRALYPGRLVTAVSQDVRSLAGIAAFPDRGFPLPKLKLILYILAIQKPGKFYLASISAEEKPLAAAPMVIAHRRVAALFPWIDERGAFQLAVFEASRETSLETLAGLYRAALPPYFHLVEIPVVPGFKLPSLDFPPL